MKNGSSSQGEREKLSLHEKEAAQGTKNKGAGGNTTAAGGRALYGKGRGSLDRQGPKAYRWTDSEHGNPEHRKGRTFALPKRSLTGSLKSVAPEVKGKGSFQKVGLTGKKNWVFAFKKKTASAGEG